jgi:hypothetical protein
MAATKTTTKSPTEPEDPEPEEPSEARQKFLAGELTWREYCEAEG